MPDVVVWKLTRSALEHENNLIHGRLTILLQSQAFLFAAFGVILSLYDSAKIGGRYPSMVALLLAGIGVFGMYVCLVIQQGVARANDALAQLTEYYDRVTDRNDGTDKWLPPLHVWRQPAPLMDHQHLPVALVILWFIILAILLVAWSIHQTYPVIAISFISLILVGGGLHYALKLLYHKLGDRYYRP